jgi:hypothetical protein
MITKSKQGTSPNNGATGRQIETQVMNNKSVSPQQVKLSNIFISK